MKICTFKILFHISFFPIIIIFNPQLLSKPVNRRSINQEGSPFISQYFSDDYKAFSQNWAVVQDSFGIMYFGNGDGVLTYDGTNWNLITLPNQGTVFALAKDKKGKIFVGAMGDMGYLKPDSIGRLLYVSLLPLLKKDDRNFSLIRKVYTSAKGIYFQSPEVLFY